MKNILSITMLALLCAASCKKENKNEDQLPPATQTGANTFGCLVNGKVWIPKGYQSPYPNYRLDIDPMLLEGNFLLRVYRIINTTPLNREDLAFGSDSLKNVGTYLLNRKSRLKVTWGNFDYGIGASDTTVYKKGVLKINRYDLNAGIFSGEFEFIMKKEGYDTIFITDGRFDFKL